MRVSRDTATSLGVVALVLWSTTIAFARSLSADLGTVNGAAAIFTLSGVIGCAGLLLTGRWRELARPPLSHLLGCGGLFVAYMLALYLAIGMAATDAEVVEVGIINYLWPSLTLLFAIPVLGYRTRPTLWLGVAMGFAGAGLANAGAEGLSWRGFLGGASQGSLPCALALLAAVSWALYSNLTRRLLGQVGGHAVPLFLLVSGAAFLLVRPLFHQEVRWTARTVWELAYMVLVPTLLAYSFWDVAMRRGNVILVAALSYATPVLSTIVSCWYLGVAPQWSLWAGCALVTAGALISRASVAEPPPPRESRSR